MNTQCINKSLASVFVLALTATLYGPHAKAEDTTQFQKNSETATEMTEETIDGKTVRKVRTGKVKQAGDSRVGNIQDDEVDQIQRRQKSLHLTAVGFGPFTSGNLGKGNLMYGASIGKHWEVSTTGEILAELVGAANSQGSMASGHLGFNFIPMTGSISPVAGAALGFGYGQGRNSAGDRISEGGFSGQANLGLRMFRLSETQMEIMGTYTAIFSQPSPNIFGAQLRILF